MDCFMTILTTPRLRLSPFSLSDWPFFLRLRRDRQVMRFMGEMLDEPALRTLFAARCADPGVFVLRDKKKVWPSVISACASAVKIRMKPMSDMPHPGGAGSGICQ